MKKIVPGGLAGLLAAAVLAAPALAGPTVTVRVEGQATTLVERTRVTLPDTPAPVSGCGTETGTVAAAIEEATHGNWDRQAFVSTIMGESHTFAANDYWAEWVDSGAGYRAGGGICTDVMHDGDEALMLVDVASDTFAPSRFPLDLEGVPAVVATGKPVTVTVVAYVSPDLAIGSGTRTPVAGATVAGGGVSAETGSDGTATLSFGHAGSVVLKASKAGSVISAGEPLTVADAPPAVGPPTGKPDDKTAPTATLAGLADGKVFKHGKGPRTLAGTVSPDPSGLSAVRLSIVRKLGKRCWAYGGATERFTRHRCGGWKYFKVGDRNDWSYLLPKRLARGRYTIRVAATDKSANRSESQVVIRVK